MQRAEIETVKLFYNHIKNSIHFTHSITYLSVTHILD